MESVLGCGLLLPHVAAFKDEGFTVEILKGHIPDEDLEELGLPALAIAAFRLRIWALSKLGDEMFHEKNDGVSSIELLERRSPSIRTALTLNSEDLKKIFKRMATRRVFLNALQQELAKTPATRAWAHLAFEDLRYRLLKHGFRSLVCYKCSSQSQQTPLTCKSSCLFRLFPQASSCIPLLHTSFL